MKKSIIALGLLAASTASVFTSCEDMMTVETGDKAYVNANDTLYSYLGIMRAMQDVAERQVILGEIRGDLVSSSDYTTDTLFAISNFDNPKDKTCSMLNVSDYYNIINNCNFYLANADTSAIKSNIKYMIPEYAQVKAIRAWVYLQLVKNYKEVPFITQPVNNLDVINNFDYANNLVNKDNLVDRLIEDGILDFLDTRYPQYGDKDNEYGSWNNGQVKISSSLCYIPIRLILGDLYLLRGNGETDYRKAASYYYEWLKNQQTPMVQRYFSETFTFATGKYIYSTGANFTPWAATYNTTAESEVISLIPGSANAGLGKMLTRVADIFGFTPTSSQSKDADVNDNGEATGEYTSGGAITVTPTYKRQYGPSGAYTKVNNEQTYVNWTGAVGVDPNTVSYYENSDARFGYTVQDFRYEGTGYPLCCKAAKGGTFYYTIPTYRKTLVWLRLAEAINRAGFPEFAFALLKDGINQFTLPHVGDRFTPKYDEHGFRVIINDKDNITIYQDESQDKVYWWYDEEGKFVPYTDRVSGTKWVAQFDTIPNDSIYLGSSFGPMYYVTDKEIIGKFNSFLNFKDDVWNKTYGIHARGCGFGSWIKTDQTAVRTNIAGYNDSTYYDYSKLILKQGVVLDTADKSEVINAVENIIVDELALETAFEGNRFTDLVRIAEHKEASGFKGIEWLANKIGQRNVYTDPTTGILIGRRDEALYNKLLNTANWYFELPAWNK